MKVILSVGNGVEDNRKVGNCTYLDLGNTAKRARGEVQERCRVYCMRVVSEARWHTEEPDVGGQEDAGASISL